MHPYVYISIQTYTVYGITGLGSEVASPGQVPEDNQRLAVLALYSSVHRTRCLCTEESMIR